MREDDTRLLRALRLVFLPLANLMLKNRIGVAPVVEQLKLAYVEAARSNHGRTGKPASVNMISRLCGMSRNHVADLVTRVEHEPDAGDMRLPIESSILSNWLSSEDYLDEQGGPKQLEFGPGHGTFLDLVEGLAPAGEVDVIVESLFRSGNVEKTEEGLAQLVARTYRISRDLPRNLSVSLASLASTIDRNWGKQWGDGFCQRVAHSQNISSRNVAMIRRISKQRIGKFLEEFDDLLCSYESDDNGETTDPEGRELSRLGVGAYYFEVTS